MTQPAGNSTAGVLQIPAAATQKNASSAPAKKVPKPPASRLKLVIRRLPPGLTQAELEAALGQEWKVGAGKMDWLSYKPGKVSKEYGHLSCLWFSIPQADSFLASSSAKPSRPSRAYIHLMSNEHITALSDQVRQASYQDARHTSHDPVLLGPPMLEFAPYAKTPGHRVRKDARQGTIDQDPDFIAFLESLTMPVTRPSLVEGAEGEEKKESVVTTPLVQFIKEKKASKAKDGSSKTSKRSEKDTKPDKVQAKKLLQRPDKETVPTPSERKTKGDKAGKESTKAAKAAVPATKGGKTTTQRDQKESTGVSVEKKRERGNVAAAAKILQRDLGLSTAGGRRRGKGGSTETGSPKTESSRDSSAPAADSSQKDPATKQAKGTTSAASSTKTGDGEPPSTKASTSDAATPPTPNPPPAKPAKSGKVKASSGPGPTSTQAFLKHANPSQGVTEALLEAAFVSFGTVTKVEIDKKKGFGYVDFAEPEGLQKAIAASPVPVAQSQLVVLERKPNPSSDKSRKGRADPQQPGGSGGTAKTVEGSGGGNQSSSRGSRGGRGSRNKGKGGGDGSKGGRQGNGQEVTRAEKPAGDAT